MSLFKSSIMTAFAVLCFARPALADLQVFPLRVNLDEKNRTAQVSLRHKGDKPMRYRIKTVLYKMSEDGSMTEEADPTKDGEYAGELFRYSPKQVLLQPNIEQVVRIILRMPTQTADGEYRAYLHFEGMDDTEEQAPANPKATAAQMSLKARLALAIPVIVRKGTISSTVQLSDLQILPPAPAAVGAPAAVDNKAHFTVALTKTGNASVYGDIQILRKAKETDKDGEVVATVNGVSSYIPKRIVSFPMEISDAKPGIYELVFKKPTMEGGQAVATTQTLLKPAKP